MDFSHFRLHWNLACTRCSGIRIYLSFTDIRILRVYQLYGRWSRTGTFSTNQMSSGKLWKVRADTFYRTVMLTPDSDVDGAGAQFVDSNMIKSSTAGGDFAGQTAESALRAGLNPASNAE